MSHPETLVLGEFRRTIDDRYRLTIPNELAGFLGDERSDCVLAKERPGCLSLWRADDWKLQLEKDIEVIRSKILAGRLRNRHQEVQILGRLLSTRHKPIQLAGRGRLVIPEGFREFLGCEAGEDVMVVGAAVCVEIWHCEAWIDCLREQIPRFGQLLEQLSE